MSADSKRISGMQVGGLYYFRSSSGSCNDEVEGDGGGGRGVGKLHNSMINGRTWRAPVKSVGNGWNPHPEEGTSGRGWSQKAETAFLTQACQKTTHL